MPDELNPSTNIEKFLAKTAGESVELPEPATRIEQYLNKIASEQSIVNTTESWLAEHINPQTGYAVDNTLSVAGAAADAKATGDALDAQSKKIDDVVIISDTQPTSENNKIWIDSDADSVQLPTMDDYNALLDNIPTATTESAEVAVITDGASNLPIKSLTVGSGATKLTRIGKNIVPTLTEEVTRYGIKFSANPDGSIHAQGTATDSTWITLVVASKMPIASLKLAVGDTVTISCSKGICGISFFDLNDTRISFKNATANSSETVVIPENTVSCDINAIPEMTATTSGTVINEDIYFQIEIGSVATSWERNYLKEYILTDGVSNEQVTTIRGYNRMWADSGNISVTYRQDLSILINSLA